VKDYIKEKDLRCDGDLPDAASQELADLLDEAAERAKANGRKTVRPEDL
jgi:histone H3/H4